MRFFVRLRVQAQPTKSGGHRRHKEGERLFRRLKGFHRTVSRFDKLDLLFIALICFVPIVKAPHLSTTGRRQLKLPGVDSN